MVDVPMQRSWPWRNRKLRTPRQRLLETRNALRKPKTNWHQRKTPARRVLRGHCWQCVSSTRFEASPPGLSVNSLQPTTAAPTGYGEALYLAAEQGVVFVSTNQGKSWQRSETGYAGNLYGVLPMAGADGNQILLAYGFKGHLFRSLDQGAHWSALPRESSRKTWVQAQAQEGTAWLLTEDGRLFTSRDRGETLTPFGTSPLAIRRFAGFTLQGNRLVAVGLGGASLHVLDNRP